MVDSAARQFSLTTRTKRRGRRMECPSCGASLREGAVFCSSCGQRISSQTIQTRVPPPSRAGDWDSSDEEGAETIPLRPAVARPSPPGPALGDSAGGGFDDGAERGARPSSRGARAGASAPDLSQTGARLRRLARFDTSVFREARDDPAALIPALVVAGVSILLMALGGWLWLQFKLGENPLIDSGRFFFRSVIFGTIFGVAAWAGWVWAAAAVLSYMFRRPTSFRGLAGALGLAAAPMAVGLLMFIDPLRTAFGVGAVAAAAMLTQTAMQESTDATPGEAFIANSAGLALFVIVLALLGRGSANLAPGIFSLPSLDIPSSLFG